MQLNNLPHPSNPFNWSGFGRLTSLPQSLAALAPFCQPVAPVSSPIETAAGRIAAAPLYAPAPLPPFPVALRDGWAVRARETIGASSAAPCFASAPPARIAFGGAAPPDADAVLAPNSVDGTAVPPEIFETAAQGEGLRLRGSDFTAGAVIGAEGEVLRPDRAALLRLAGIGAVSVRIPRIAILAAEGGGDWIAAMARREGADCEVIPLGGEGRRTKPAAADLWLAIGEAGRVELESLAARGPVASHAVATRPGQAICGIVSTPSAPDGAPFVLTPERFECVFTAWLLLARPCLRSLAGSRICDPRRSLPLTRKIVSNPGWSDLVLLRVNRLPNEVENLPDGGEAWEPLACADIAWSAIARADAWLAVEADSEGYASGQPVFAEFL